MIDYENICGQTCNCKTEEECQFSNSKPSPPMITTTEGHSKEFVKDLQDHIATLTEQNAKLEKELHELRVKRFHEGGHSLGVEVENAKLKEDNQKLREALSFCIGNLTEREHQDFMTDADLRTLKDAQSLLEESKPLNT